MTQKLLICLLPVLAGFVLDLLLGDPQWLYHPVRLIGRFIALGEGRLRRFFPKTQAGQQVAGIVLATTVPLMAFGVSWLLLFWAARIDLRVAVVLESIQVYFLVAARSLEQESMAVSRSLEQGLPAARQQLSRIVGRDTGELDEQGIIRAAVETVAENTSDGVVAPLFYVVLGGAPLGWAYKAVNTLDSMVGYRNDRYRYFGMASAKLDDMANYLPSRLAALLMALAAIPVTHGGRESFRIWRRDRRNHASPNSAQTEAACAGALGIQLGGDAVYFGKRYAKPTIGDSHRPAIPEDIKTANRLMYATSFLAMYLLLLCKAMLLVL